MSEAVGESGRCEEAMGWQGVGVKGVKKLDSGRPTGARRGRLADGVCKAEACQRGLQARVPLNISRCPEMQPSLNSSHSNIWLCIGAMERC